MSKFIWIRDRDKREHFVNVDHIVRVTRVLGTSSYSQYGYVVLNEGHSTQKSLDLSDVSIDTFEEVIEKIAQATS
jgi:hypothetical protein